jgi:hypothetical protein|tara:strand:+ start:144 stop:1346 length:1203 start_codon:yes stop_codon:yes gene_type:complete
MSFLNGFLDNVFSGALNPKGNLADYQHGARLYVDDSHRLSPKVKFLYHVSFNINSQAASIIPQLTQKHSNELNMLVKSVQLPAYNIQTDVKHQYNRKRVIQKRIDYQPINIVFHDDNFGVTTAMWEAYYRYYYRDGNYTAVQPDGSPDPTKKQFKNPTQFNRGSAFAQKQYRYGFDNDSLEPFFNSIVIYQMSRKKYTAMTLVNPIIASWTHDTMDNSVSDPVSNSMSVEYETVHYSRGAIGKGGPKGFAEEHYDKTPSPNSLLGGGASSLLGVGGVLAGGFGVIDDITGGNVSFGTVLKAANTIQNAGNLSSSGIGGELLGEGISAIGRTTGIDVSGVSNVAFPKGAGGGSTTTVAAAAALVAGANFLTNSGSSGAQTSSTASTTNNPSGPAPGMLAEE